MQQRIDIPQLPSHQPLSDSVQVDTQVTGCGSSEGNSDDSGVGYEEEIKSKSSNEEEPEEDPHGAASQMLLDDGSAVVYGWQDQIDYSLYDNHDGADPIDARHNASDTGNNNRDGAIQGFDAGVSQDPLLGKLSPNKHLRFLAYQF